MSNLEARLIALIARQLRVEENTVTPNASLREDLEADSLQIVELIMALEDEFGIQIPDQDTEKITTVQQAIAYVARATDGKPELSH